MTSSSSSHGTIETPLLTDGDPDVDMRYSATQRTAGGCPCLSGTQQRRVTHTQFWAKTADGLNAFDELYHCLR